MVLLFTSERLDKGTYHILKEGDKDFSVSPTLRCSAALSECNQCTEEALEHRSREAHLNFSTCSESILNYLWKESRDSFHSQTHLLLSSLESPSLPNYTLKQKGLTNMALLRNMSIPFSSGAPISQKIANLMKIQCLHFGRRRRYTSEN